MLKHLPRLGALLGVTLLFLIASPVQPIYATTITVDGDPADWPMGSLLVDDTVGEDAYLPGMDIDNVYFTNNPTVLFGRVDTATPPAATGWGSFPTMHICFDTVPLSGAPSDGPRCTFEGMDFRLAIDGLGAGSVDANLYSCPNTLCNAFIGSASVSAATNNNVTEFSINLSALGIVAPGGTYQAFILFDNQSAPPDDFVLNGPATFALPIPGPTPITLTSLSATRSGGGVTVRWETASEIGVQGFHVLRSATGRREDAVRVTGDPIDSSGNSVTGASYSFPDTSAAASNRYTYWLEVINNDDSREEYGPIAYRAGLAEGFGVYLPLVRR